MACSFPDIELLAMAENKSENKSVIGYGIAMDKGEKKKELKVADCLIPTYLVINTYGNRATLESDVQMGWSGDGDRNCVVYCDMTEGRKVSGELMLQWSGNFTSAAMADKERRVDGSMCLRRGLFLDKYVIPMLKQYNDDMQIVPKHSKKPASFAILSPDFSDQVTFSRDGSAGGRRYHWNFDAVLGYNQEHPDWNESYFDFSENPAAGKEDRFQKSMLTHFIGGIFYGNQSRSEIWVGAAARL